MAYKHPLHCDVVLEDLGSYSHKSLGTSELDIIQETSSMY